MRRASSEISAPKEFNLAYGNFEALKFLHEVRECADSTDPGLHFSIDLKDVRSVDINAAIVLVAEMDRLQRRKFLKLFPLNVADWDPGVVAELRSLGFFKLLGTALPKGVGKQTSRAFIQFTSDTLTIGKAAELLRRRLERETMGSTGYDQQLYVVLVEAMKNAFQHAYPDDLSDFEADPLVGRRWWMAASYDRQSSLLDVAFLDLGVTIPRSLPFSWMWDVFGDETKLGSAAVQITAAMRYGHSRFNEAHRGKGFANINAPAHLDDRNHVSVLSGRGMCFTTASNVVAFEPRLALEGTLIAWHLYVNR